MSSGNSMGSTKNISPILELFVYSCLYIRVVIRFWMVKHSCISLTYEDIIQESKQHSQSTYWSATSFVACLFKFTILKLTQSTWSSFTHNLRTYGCWAPHLERPTTKDVVPRVQHGCGCVCV